VFSRFSGFKRWEYVGTCMPLAWLRLYVHLQCMCIRWTVVDLLLDGCFYDYIFIPYSIKDGRSLLEMTLSFRTLPRVVLKTNCSFSRLVIL